MHKHAENEVSKSRPSKVITQTGHTDIHTETNRQSELKHYHAATYRVVLTNQ